ncbi:SGNH/GDSL hydrolase family protein [Bartonella sp. CB74]|uniref:SGNH/GDSL hydrolase family protein n=1 Tax=Bartonella sp. CB74 TaxID=3113620 RepID=UPI003FA58274
MHLICLLFFTFSLIVIQQAPSEAQNFFESLFEHKKQEQQPQIIEQKIYKPQKKIVTQKSVQKLKEEKVKRILVIGDFVAFAVADALKKLFTENHDIIIINNTVPDSGLVRTDYYSWKNNISELIDKNKPQVIVMMIGANDNQPITTPNGVLRTVDPEWMNIYKQRVTEIAESLHNSGKPWIWVGQPAFKNNNLTQKMRIFNTFYKNATETKKGCFIDIWDGFIDAEGQFSFSGYDVNGKTITLRTHDGINFTSAGKQKIASYLKRKLEIILNFHLSSYENIYPINTNTLQFIQEPHNIKRQPPITLDNMAQQNTHLLNKIDSSFMKKSWSPPNGHQIDRADNFSFP